MTTSGSTDFSVSKDDIVKAAYQKIGMVSEGGTPTTDQYTEGSLLLNLIVKAYAASLKIPLWAVKYGAIFPQSLTTPHSLELGPEGGHASNEIIHLTLGDDHVETDTVITLSSIDDLESTDYIGIELDSGDIHWTEINGEPNAIDDQVTLFNELPEDASEGNHVWAYTNKLERPMRILEAWTRDYTDSSNFIDLPIEIITPSEYNALTNKAIESYPLKLCYEALINHGVVRYWPGFSDGSKIIYFRYHRVFEDFDLTMDTPDFPQEWFMPLVYELACALAPNYNLDREDRKSLRSEADRWVALVLPNDYEEGSIRFFPQMRF